jgi:hypothetical protein
MVDLLGDTGRIDSLKVDYCELTESVNRGGH